MPGRKENYILLEQSVTVDSKNDVDALVSRIGEVLQLHNNPSGHPRTGSAQELSTHGCCMRLRNHRGSSRSSPYQLSSSHGDQDWDQIRPWNRKRVRGDSDDPHRLLQDLLLSGNLIKEAVRRLQFSAADNVSYS
uniref:Glycogen synthase kinase binding protein n=1 Tax=Nothobranchius korthausae TaxID=1143690 RepID=A0A1A8HGK5_9TELE